MKGAVGLLNVAIGILAWLLIAVIIARIAYRDHTRLMMRRFWQWINETDASKVNALLGAVGFALALFVVGLMALIAFGSHVRYDRVIAIPPVWVDVLDSILIATAVWAGVSQAAQIGRRAATNPKVVEAEAAAEAKKVVAKAQADVVRKSGEMMAIRDDAVGDGRTTAMDDPSRGLSDDGEPL